jgi:Peptidase family M49
METMMKRYLVHLSLILPLLFISCGDSSKKDNGVTTELTPKIKRFAPVAITADTSRLSPGDRRALAKLVEAASFMDKLYLRQAWAGNEALLRTLKADQSPEGRDRLRFFYINMGPWSDLDDNKAFVPGVPTDRPPQANYYPPDMTREEFTAWLSGLPEEQQKQATGFFTVIRRDPAQKLLVIPYNQEYRDLLVPAANLLRDAAAFTDNASLRKFLETRAAAFLSNDYYESDVAWMELDSPVEPTIGPYEVYMDGLFNYKAAFEAFIGIRNDQETAKLARFSSYLQEIENNLPIAAAYRNPSLGALAPIRVIDQVALGGEARAGIQTAAFNLPNDEHVVAEKGSKRVMLKNVQEAKFTKILVPIAGLVIDPSQQASIAFEPFFTHILAHELVHGLGPHTILVKGKQTTVRKAMKEIGSAFEEAKADVAGLFALQYLIDKGVLPKETESQMYTTFLASTFRSVRFGINEAHGRGIAMIFNYFMQAKAYEYNEATGTFRVNFDRVKEAARKLTGEIMTLQAHGDYEGAHRLLDRYAVVEGPLQRTLAKLTAIPVDIVPVQTEGD